MGRFDEAAAWAKCGNLWMFANGSGAPFRGAACHFCFDLRAESFIGRRDFASGRMRRRELPD
jgi:hypothetical protein